jgi:hypothetical protein
MNKAISSTMDLLMQSRAAIYVIDPTVNAAPPAQFINDVGGPNTLTPFSATDPLQRGSTSLASSSKPAESIFTDATT